MKKDADNSPIRIIFASYQKNSFMNQHLAVSFTLLLLMTGQRIAQDYSGAMNITVYFMLTVIGIFMLELI